MEDLSLYMEQVLAYFEKTRKKLSFEKAKKDIVIKINNELTKIKGEERTSIFERALNALVENGSLFFNEKTCEYETMKNKPGLELGVLNISKNGSASVSINGKKVYIDINDLNGALDGDTVIVKSIYEKHKRSYGEIYKIVKRDNPNLIFEVIGDGLEATLLPPVGFNTHINVELSKNDRKKLKDGEFIVVTVGTQAEDGIFTGTLERVINETKDNKLKTLLVANKFDVATEFPEEVLKEAREIPQEVRKEDLVGRIDLRDKKFFTIDCDNTKDRDDAICVEKLPNGNYKLYTAISHVSYYVKPGSAIFKEAMKRCTSHYPNDDHIPMLPPELSSGICSLNENVDRLVRVTEVEINPNETDPDKRIVDSKIYPSVICSRKEMKYSDVNKVLDREYVSHLYEFKDDIFLINELNKVLEKDKHDRGCLVLDTREKSFIRDTNDTILDIIEQPRGFAERIIENFMVLTNTITVSTFSYMPLPYRVHEDPDISRVQRALGILQSAGCELEKVTPNEYNVRYILVNAIEALEELECKNVLIEILIKSMKRAKYSLENCKHFALGLFYYSHTTSPIRRAIDLAIHTLIDLLESGEFDLTNLSLYEEFEEIINALCVSANKAEKLDFDMEKFAEAINIAEYAASHIGEEVVTNVTEFYGSSMLLTSDKYRGILDFSDMDDYRCYYDKNKDCVRDRNSNTTFKIGKKVCVLIKSADRSEGIIHFKMPKQKVLRMN